MAEVSSPQTEAAVVTPEFSCSGDCDAATLFRATRFVFGCVAVSGVGTATATFAEVERAAFPLALAARLVRFVPIALEPAGAAAAAFATEGAEVVEAFGTALGRVLSNSSIDRPLASASRSQSGRGPRPTQT